MIPVKDGQCGLCEHYGHDHAQDPTLVQIRVNGKAPEGYVDECSHPKHAALNLHVTPNSGCDGFKPAMAA